MGFKIFPNWLPKGERGPPQLKTPTKEFNFWGKLLLQKFFLLIWGTTNLPPKKMRAQNKKFGGPSFKNTPGEFFFDALYWGCGAWEISFQKRKSPRPPLSQKKFFFLARGGGAPKKYFSSLCGGVLLRGWGLFVGEWRSKKKREYITLSISRGGRVCL